MNEHNIFSKQTFLTNRTHPFHDFHSSVEDRQLDQPKEAGPARVTIKGYIVVFYVLTIFDILLFYYLCVPFGKCNYFGNISLFLLAPSKPIVYA